MRFLSLIILLAISFSHNAFSQDSLRQTVVVVFDDSGSMSGYLNNTSDNKLDVAKSCLINNLSTLPSGSKVGLVLLNGGKDNILSKIDSNLFHRIKLIEAIGGTRLADSIIIGANLLLTERQKYKNEIYRLLIITDGEAEDVELASIKVKETMSRGIVVDCIGLNMIEEHSLTNIVSHYMNANTKEQLFDSINKSFAEVGLNDNLSNDFELLNGLSEEDSFSIIKTLSETGNDLLTNDENTPFIQHNILKNIKNVFENSFCNLFLFYLGFAILFIAILFFAILFLGYMKNIMKSII